MDICSNMNVKLRMDGKPNYYMLDYMKIRSVPCMLPGMLLMSLWYETGTDPLRSCRWVTSAAKQSKHQTYRYRATPTNALTLPVMLCTTELTSSSGTQGCMQIHKDMRYFGSVTHRSRSTNSDAWCWSTYRMKYHDFYFHVFIKLLYR